MTMRRYRDVGMAVVEAIEALARLSTWSPSLEALTILLLAPRVLTRAAFLLRWHSLLSLLLRLSNFFIACCVYTIDTATSQGVARDTVFKAVAVSLGASVFVAIALDFAFACSSCLSARL